MAPVIDYMWPKAKLDDIIALNDKTIWRFLELSKEYDVLSSEGRATVCDRVSNELNAQYTYRCKARILKNGKKPTKKQLSSHSEIFMQYASIMAFVIYGDLKQKYNLITA